ncbi:hypothetical protein V502_02278 [Pseudogymnoascus sp. VKM F-4520 (FW-2644)]|nr:hypothetical protein V502_02278 [Pseudogymnoascus sp. VKM F-4520 (FW-2644)]
MPDVGSLAPVQASQRAASLSALLFEPLSGQKSDLSFINIEGVVSSAKTTDTSNQCEVLDTNPSLCTSNYQFPFTNNIVLNPVKLPLGKPGSEPVTNLPGNAARDAWLGGGGGAYFKSGCLSRTITLALWDSKAGAVTGTGKGAVATGTGTGSGGQGGQTTGTATGSAAPSSTTNGGGKINAHYFLVGGGSAVLIFLDLCNNVITRAKAPA